MSTDKLPAALIVGGDHGCLSIARSLGSAGIPVYAINPRQSVVRYSRFCRWIDLPDRNAIGTEVWAAYLLGCQSNHLRGAVLLAASDEAIELIAEHRQSLSEKFTLDLSNPVILKPILGHKFSRKFTGSYAVAYHFDELLNAFDAVCCAGIRTFLVEMIPGPDDKLCSYYTYLDENGKNLIDFTKRVIRRYPMNMGGSTYHMTDYVPDVQELGLALFRHVGLRGVANVEFKLDERDGMLKLIECNARFTAADCLLVASGLNLPLLVYNRLTGRAQAASSRYRMGMRLWKPVGDFAAYRQLNKMGLLTFRAWIRSIMHPQILPVFRWNDPLPGIIGGARWIGYAWSRFRPSTLSRKVVPQPLQLSRLPQSSTLPSTAIIRSDLTAQIEPTIELLQK